VNLKQRRSSPKEGSEQRSRANAVRVIGALEDAEDYKAFEAAIIADYDDVYRRWSGSWCCGWPVDFAIWAALAHAAQSEESARRLFDC
jgi:hypothetical protein